MDAWDRKTNFHCISCMFCVPKGGEPGKNLEAVGRCRKNAPTMDGYPVIKVYHDWCGKHRLGSNPVRDANKG